MEEKELIRGEMGYLKKIKRVSIIFLVLTLVFGVAWFFLHDAFTNYDAEIYLANSKYNRGYITKSERDSMVNLYQKQQAPYVVPQGVSAFLGIASFVVLVLYFDVLVSSKNQEITVSNGRVFGTSANGKTVDIPIDSITSVGTSRRKGIVVSSADGKHKFFGMDNRDEVQKAISDLLLLRQNEARAEPKQETPQSAADELEKFKGLLDKGIISQEEFDAKKKQLLGL